MGERSSPSRWSAGCIIATHDAQPEPKSRSHAKSGVSCAHCVGLKRMPQSDSRLSNRRQRTQGSELCHLRHHRRSRLATDKVLRNDTRIHDVKPLIWEHSMTAQVAEWYLLGSQEAWRWAAKTGIST
jgi:hypothetical protein